MLSLVYFSFVVTNTVIDIMTISIMNVINVTSIIIKNSILRDPDLSKPRSSGLLRYSETGMSDRARTLPTKPKALSKTLQFTYDAFD